MQLDAFDEAVGLFGKAIAADASLSSALQEKQKLEDMIRKVEQVEQLLADEEYGRAVAIITPLVRMYMPDSQVSLSFTLSLSLSLSLMTAAASGFRAHRRSNKRSARAQAATAREDPPSPRRLCR